MKYDSRTLETKPVFPFLAVKHYKVSLFFLPPPPHSRNKFLSIAHNYALDQISKPKPLLSRGLLNQWESV